MTDEEIGFWIGVGTVFIIFGILNGYWYKRKGGSAAQGFFLSILLSPILAAIIILVSKPNKVAQEKAELKSGQYKKCPACAELIKSEAVKCRFCGQEIAPVVTP